MEISGVREDEKARGRLADLGYLISLLDKPSLLFNLCGGFWPHTVLRNRAQAHGCPLSPGGG